MGHNSATNTLITAYKKLAVRKGATIVRNLWAMNNLLIQQNNGKNSTIKDIGEFVMPEE